MKTLVVVAAGAADRPLEELKGRTPLEAAATPALDRIARDGRMGRLVPAPKGVPPDEGAFAVALFGLDPLSYGEAGATLEAAAFDVPVAADDLVFRVALVSADDKTIYDATAGGMLRDEAALLLAALDDATDDEFSFHAGAGARHLLVWKGARKTAVETTSPFELVGARLKNAWPRGRGAKPLLAMIETSRDVFAGHDVNELRFEMGENPATLAWPWGPGVSIPLPDFVGRVGQDVLAVGVDPCFLGAARLQGIETVTPRGCTGLPGSNLRAKADAALRALETHDLVYLHVNALTAAARSRDFVAKVETLEKLDGYVLGLILRALERGLEARLVVVGGPGVSTETGRCLQEPAPFVIHGPGVRSLRKGRFTESGARDAGFQVDRPHELLPFLLQLPT